MGVVGVGRGRQDAWDWLRGTLPGLGLGSLYAVRWEGIGWLVGGGCLEGDWLAPKQAGLGLAGAKSNRAGIGGLGASPKGGVLPGGGQPELDLGHPGGGRWGDGVTLGSL